MNTERLRLGPLAISTGGLLLTTVFYTFPRAVAIAAATAAPWMILVVGALLFLLYWPVLATLARRPGTTLIDLARAAGGRPLAIVTALLLGGYFLASAGITLRQSSEMVVTSLYPHTPQTFAMVSLVAAAAVAAHMSPAGLVWIGAVSAPPILLAVLIVLVGNIGWGQFRNLLPLSGPGLLPLSTGLLPLTAHFYPFAYLTMFAGLLASPRGLVKGAATVVGVTSAVFALVILFYLMVFPLPGGIDVPFPLFEMTRLVQGGRYLERVDAIWIAFWTFGSAVRLASTLMTTSLMFKHAFRLPDHRGAVLPLTMAILSWALVPANQVGALDIETYILRPWGFVFVPVAPLAIALVAGWRQRRQHRQAGGSHHA
ncbi:MAG TPA: GerAB/ArcD/ProY family transporter [Symbiobacteriaceae bacterium]|nr:GerAB/ArcD/ProY family transporter [Symbiobacteriaceae bacterium]